MNKPVFGVPPFASRKRREMDVASLDPGPLAPVRVPRRKAWGLGGGGFRLGGNLGGGGRVRPLFWGGQRGERTRGFTLDLLLSHTKNGLHFGGSWKRSVASERQRSTHLQPMFCSFVSVWLPWMVSLKAPAVCFDLAGKPMGPLFARWHVPGYLQQRYLKSTKQPTCGCYHGFGQPTLFHMVLLTWWGSWGWHSRERPSGACHFACVVLGSRVRFPPPPSRGTRGHRHVTSRGQKSWLLAVVSPRIQQLQVP